MWLFVCCSFVRVLVSGACVGPSLVITLRVLACVCVRLSISLFVCLCVRVCALMCHV